MTLEEIASAIWAETIAARQQIVKHYGYSYCEAWTAGRAQAVEEIRKLEGKN